jgi:hypothetical protein
MNFGWFGERGSPRLGNKYLGLMQTEQKFKAAPKELDDLQAALDEHAFVAITDRRTKFCGPNRTS